MPQRMDGLMMLPPVSLPMLNPTNPAAVAAPGPALDPEEASSSSQGFIVWPPNQMSLSARAPRLSLATSTAPASCRRFTTTASSAGTRLRNGSAPYVVGMPAVSRRSFAAPRNAVQRSAIFAGGDFFVGLLRLLQRQVASQRDDAVQLGIELLAGASDKCW